MKTPANIPGRGIVFSVRAALAAITYQGKLEKLDSDLKLRHQWNDLRSLVRCEKALEMRGAEWESNWRMQWGPGKKKGHHMLVIDEVHLAFKKIFLRF